MTDDELRSAVIALQLRWHGAYAVGTTPAGTWYAIPVAAPDTQLEASDAAGLDELLRADQSARAARSIRATAGQGEGNASC
ncbi:MAG: hypothetical protein ABJB47_01580 [Actinomycetota bacterium]